MFNEIEKEQIVKAFNELDKDAKIELLTLVNEKILDMIKHVDEMKL